MNRVRDRMRWFHYNWFKVPLSNFLWQSGLSAHSREYRRDFPGRPLPLLGRMTLADLKWARASPGSPFPAAQE